MIYRKETPIGGKPFIIETGKLAKQANGAAWVQLGETVILATAVCDKTAKEDIDFFPLSVDYREKAYAVGKIPGGFFKREGKPSDTEVLSARLVDRPIRPLFPEAYRNETQVFIWVLSADREHDADVLGITGASIALNLSDIPIQAVIAGVRVGRINGEFIVNPTYAQKIESDIDLVMAASEDSVLMVEGAASEISEEDMVAALEFGHEEIRKIIAVEKEIIALAGKPKMTVVETDWSELDKQVKKLAGDSIAKALEAHEKQERQNALAEVVDAVLQQMTDENSEPAQIARIKSVIHDLEKELMRGKVLNTGVRLDGRKADEIREITVEVGVLPRAHGSALFTRGQTQALAATTLGTKIDEQRIEGLEGEFWKSYMLHYNFPPFATGEVKPVRGVSRREVGHGNLAERAIKPMIPSDQIFPYTLRIVSDVLESNGSSSMATVCAGSLSLMDAGVPVKDAVAGIAMGLIKEGDRVVILTDILGDEDHLGDMDFKVAGTQNGITAFQMDIKIAGISKQIMSRALQQAKEARHYVLSKMKAVLPEPRKSLSNWAPRILTIKIPVDSIGTVIGPGGKTIREIIEKTGATIDIADDGTVTIASVEAEAGEAAARIVRAMTAEVEVGEIYTGKVKRILNFGAFVEILPGREGLLHISAIENRRIDRVEDVLKIGDEVTVKVIKVEGGKIDLSRKVLLNRDKPAQDQKTTE
ncbi:MAG TPA: polyribonucleotide nucleotidyltransferase [bacterium]|nr:polyribonucleotide nucleotidyltransferase [bacterium]HPG46401.1 polyribonucleotide nucleotidyltransferase [bacterium]HPM98685.1 polyribonucleotide nucleotidyltransferase [bacterium]